jgi:hypothetical protein
LKKCAIWAKKRGAFKVADKKGVVIKGIKSVDKKASTLNWDSRKDALRASQELARPSGGLNSGSQAS